MDVTINGFALVTGAGSGIGRDCALAYAAAGAAGVAFADLNLGDAEQALIASKTIATNPKYRAIALEVDIAKEDSVNDLVSKVVAVFGRLDYALNSAGVSCLAQSRDQLTDAVCIDWRPAASRDGRS